jgi:hypothetical protein
VIADAVRHFCSDQLVKDVEPDTDDCRCTLECDGRDRAHELGIVVVDDGEVLRPDQQIYRSR